jgi:hypothetical protein
MKNSNFLTRAYNKIEKISNGRIVKSSTSSRLNDEINYYDSIPNHVSFLFPRKFSSSRINDEYSMILEYYPYKNLGEYIISNLSINWNDVFDNIKSIIELFRSQNDKDDNTSSHAKQMYFDKTINEYINFKNSFEDSDLFYNDVLILNGNEYKNFEIIWNESNTNKILNDLLNYKSNMIHGDMCFSNILYHDIAGIKLIDMRGSFGKKGIHGDTLYDLSKLAHSIDGGYEFFINDKFNVKKIYKNEYELTLNNTQNKKDAFDSFWLKFSNENKKNINFIQGMIYIGMCARHYDSKERQLAMYLTGIKILNETL